MNDKEFVMSGNDWFNEPHHNRNDVNCDICGIEIGLGESFIDFPNVKACKYCVENFSTSNWIHYSDFKFEVINCV